MLVARLPLDRLLEPLVTNMQPPGSTAPIPARSYMVLPHWSVFTAQP